MRAGSRWISDPHFPSPDRQLLSTFCMFLRGSQQNPVTIAQSDDQDVKKEGKRGKEEGRELKRARELKPLTCKTKSILLALTFKVLIVNAVIPYLCKHI